uniref:Uncharacterized protein n=1 Tax=uncultured prokaryote TaxID=198431 RepID=A0A0H5Q3I9_9ZZZZ|nr:hypothetical protein [uncultured prokaryote]
MPFPSAHSLLTFSGPAYADQEEWSTGCRLRRSTPPTLSELQGAADAFQGLCGTTALGASNAARLVSVKWAPQTTEGRYGDGEAVELLLTPSALGSNGRMPAQIAVVLSLRTARPRGRGSNGRMYIPALPTLEENTGRFSTADATTIAVAASDALSAIGSALSTDVVVGSQVGSGLLETVTGVRVGRVPDTQRRRREGLPESYSPESPVDFG